MAWIRTITGREIDADALPKDVDALLAEIVREDIELASLEEDEAEVDPANFITELSDYVRDAFRLKKNTPVEIEFRVAGKIGRVSYWVFSAEPITEYPVYLFVVRNDYVTELSCSEQSVTYRDAATGDSHNRLISPAQAALVEYCLNDFTPPPRPE